MVSGHETDISDDLPAPQKRKMLTFQGAPSGKGLEAWGDIFFLKVGATGIRVLVSKKYSFGKEGARPGPGAPVLKNAFGVGFLQRAMGWGVPPVKKILHKSRGG